MSDYAKKKNDELAALCKERGLPHTGKKAELVKRLEDHDSSTNAASDAKEAQEPEKQGQAAPAETSKEAPVADVTAENKETATIEGTDTKPAQDFSLGLTETTLDQEIEKRKKRAAKFGLDVSSDETLKQLERAKRFGGTELPGLLNQALPERAERQKKRGREGKEDKDDRKRSRQRGPEDSKKSDKPAATQKDGEAASWMTASDREKAEKRKARFATVAQ